MVIDNIKTNKVILYINQPQSGIRKAAENYIKSKITLSEAARIAEISIFDMEKYLVEQGFKSQYSIKDLKEELKHLG